MKINELLALNAEGLIPGPGENEESFYLRVQRIKENFQKEPSAEWSWPTEQLQSLFDFSPRWCTVFRSPRGLAPWQAAVTWIEEKGMCSIQLNPSALLKKLIDSKELLAHESTHTARAAFEEPMYEEIFAYLTSTKSWRRILGPLFQTPREALLFMSLILLGSLTHLAESFFDFILLSPGWFLLAFFFCSRWGFRLFLSRKRLNRAYEALIPLVRDPNKIRAVLFRLTDAEIHNLARGAPLEIKKELRWDLIKAAYLRDDL